MHSSDSVADEDGEIESTGTKKTINYFQYPPHSDIQLFYQIHQIQMCSELPFPKEIFSRHTPDGDDIPTYHGNG